MEKLSGGTDAWRRLRRQGEIELFEQDFVIGFGLGVTAQDELSTVGGRKVHIEHLNGGGLVEHCPRGKSRRQGAQSGAQSHLQAISDKGDENVGLDAMLELVKDGTQLQVVFEIFERCLDLDQLNV